MEMLSQYKKVSTCGEVEIKRSKNSDKCILVDSNTKELVIEQEYESVKCLQAGLLEVRLNGKYGVLNTTTKEYIIKPDYDLIDFFPSKKLIRVRVVRYDVKELYGLFNLEGRCVLEAKYRKIDVDTNADCILVYELSHGAGNTINTDRFCINNEGEELK